MSKIDSFRSRLRGALLAFSLLGTFVPVLAHHSFAMYDASQTVTFTATVKELQWTNPHVLLWLIRDPKPNEKEGEVWTIELPTSPGPLSRLGWTKHSLAPGDQIVVEISPLRSGEFGGSFKKATIVKTGQVLVAAVPASAASAP